MRRFLVLLVGSGGLAVLACATATPGAKPHEMSAGAHESEAETHTGLAEQHAGEYRPDAGIERLRCSPGGGRPGPNGSAVVVESICWTSVENPTASHLDEAAAHRRHAADHRAASAALRAAEAQACTGVALADRDTSPFERVEDIVSVRPLRRNEFEARTKTPPEMLLGAVVTFRAVPGLTAEWLQHVVDCHLARNAAVGHAVPEMPDCPLVPAGVEARVLSTGDGFAVAITSNDATIAREILSRAERHHAGQPQRKDASR